MAKGKDFIVIDNHEDRKNYNRLAVHLCAALYSQLTPATILALATLIYLLLFTKLWFIPVIYYSWLVVDSRTCNRGGRRWGWVHKARFWSYLAAHFPIRMRHSRQFKLKPTENYILTYHPHGMFALGCVCGFATDGLGFDKLFPGITSRFMSHESWFWLPLVREVFMLRGDCSVSSTSFDYILSRKWKDQQQHERGAVNRETSGDRNTNVRATGNLLALCVGGQAEAGLSDMQTVKVVCATRKGFIKKALIHGAHLVPCLAFGENSSIKKVELRPGSLAHWLEAKWYQLFKFRLPIYSGDRLFGIVPFERPITVCIGDPIEVERIVEPSQKQIDELHALYVAHLRTLYEENQDLCRIYDTKLEIL